MTKLIYILVPILVLGGLFYSRFKKATVNNVDVSTFQEKMKDENTVILDVRTPAETAKGKIEGAIEIDYLNKTFKEKVDQLDQDKTYLIYCRSGRRSVSAAQIMEEKGFSKVYNLLGGYKAWTKKNN